MTEREMILALFNLVGALAERLTGEIPILRVETETGGWVNVYPITGPSRIKWKEPDGSLWTTDEQPVPENGEPVIPVTPERQPQLHIARPGDVILILWESGAMSGHAVSEKPWAETGKESISAGYKVRPEGLAAFLAQKEQAECAVAAKPDILASP